MSNDISLFYGIAINALISTTAVVVTYIIAKQNRWNTGVTQFRQKWIDNLRDAISLFIAKAEMISMLDFSDNEAYYGHYEELSQMHTKVELLLNPTEEDHNDLVKKMDEIRELIHDETIEDVAYFDITMDEKIKELLTISKSVLKKEWIVVKTGK